jgi:uncharacterized iron-regulated protein
MHPLWLLGLMIFALLGKEGAAGGNYIIYANGKPCTFAQMVSSLATADVVFVGEEHDDVQGHLLELQILEGLYQEHPQLALSLEMFERDVQLPLDEYLQGFITEPQFLACSRPWSNYKTDYRPLVEFCKVHGLPVLAANAPRRYVNLVSREGMEALQKLPKASKAYLPPLPYSMQLPEGYSKALDVILGQAHEGRNMADPMPTLQHMKEAQALWDATMADSIARFHDRHPAMSILQINGRMHSDYGWGIVDRLKHLRPKLKIVAISIQKMQAHEVPEASALQAGDFVILTYPEEGTANVNAAP